MWDLVTKTRQWACSVMQDRVIDSIALGTTPRGNSLLLQLQGEMLPEQEAVQSVSMYLSLSFFLHPSEFHFLNPVMYRDPQMTALPARKTITMCPALQLDSLLSPTTGTEQMGSECDRSMSSVPSPKYILFLSSFNKNSVLYIDCHP